MKKVNKRSSQLIRANERLKKHVGAIHSNGALSLLERKMANVLLLNAYEELLTQRSHTIKVQLLSTMLGWNESNNTDRLKAALESLASTPITFNEMKDGKESWRVMSMISYGHIEGGICTYRYDEYLAERLFDPEIYATINLGIQRKIDGSYALSLYENCLRYKSVGSTGWWELALFRRLMGAENEYYDDFRRLNSKIIKPSVDEINRVTDIHIEPEFKKEGRRVIGLRFRIHENVQQTLFSPEDLDEYAELRNSDTFKSLRNHGIGERLAILWIVQDEERAKAVIKYVESKAINKQVKGSTGGYIRKLIEENAEVGKSNFEKNLAKEIKQNEIAENQIIQSKKLVALKDSFLREQANKKINSLSIESKRQLINEYKENEGAGKVKSLNLDTVSFNDSVEKLEFRIWLHKRFVQPFDSKEFEIWVKMKKSP